jgi:hypothetical protein
MRTRVLEANFKAGRRYGDTVDVTRAADLYAQGRTLREISAELGLIGQSASSFIAPA